MGHDDVLWTNKDENILSHPPPSSLQPPCIGCGVSLINFTVCEVSGQMQFSVLISLIKFIRTLKFIAAIKLKRII